MNRNSAEPVTASAHMVRSPFSPSCNGSASETGLASNFFHIGLVMGRQIRPLAPQELDRIGTGLQGPVPLQMWNDVMVNETSSKGRALRVLSRDKVLNAATGARAFIGHQRKNFTAPALAAVARSQEIPLEKLDLIQLAAAARYVNSAKSPAEQVEKASKALECMHVHTTVGEPPIERELMTQMLAREAGVPARSLQELRLREVQTIFGQVTAALNAGPGRSEIKVGPRLLQLSIGSNGKVSSSSLESQGFLERLRLMLTTRLPAF